MADKKTDKRPDKKLEERVKKTELPKTSPSAEPHIKKEPSGLEKKLSEANEAIIKAVKTPFVDLENFTKEHVPKILEGITTIGTGLAGGYLAGFYTYNALSYLGGVAIAPALFAGILAYPISAYLGKTAYTYLTHPIKTFSKLYRGIKSILKFPFTPIESTKSLFKYLKGMPSNLYKDIKGSTLHPFNYKLEYFPKKETENKPEDRL